MLRIAMLAFGILVAFGSSAASAQMLIPAHVNLHHGYVVVINTISPKRELRSGITEPWYPEEVPRVTLGWGGFKQWTPAPFGERAYLNQCCIAAGTLYEVEFLQGGSSTVIHVRPRLCNVRGIPFGYAVVEVGGSYVRFKDATYGTPTLHVVDASCPVDPPR